MTKQDQPGRYCGQCGNPFQEGDRFCRTCGTAVATSSQREEQMILRRNATSEDPRPADSGESRSGGYGCSVFTMGALVVGFFVLIGIANGLDPGAGWAVVVFGTPLLILSALFLIAWHWAIREMDRRNEEERRRQAREEYLRELQIRDYEERR